MIKWADEIEVDDIISYDSHECKVKKLRTVVDYVYYIGENRAGTEVCGGLFHARGIEVSKDWSEE